MTKPYDALDEDEWKTVCKRRLRWTLSGDYTTIRITDPNTGRSASGRTLCAAVRALK